MERVREVLAGRCTEWSGVWLEWGENRDCSLFQETNIRNCHKKTDSGCCSLEVVVVMVGGGWG